MSRLSSDDWQALLDIARRAISSAVIDRSIPDLPEPAGVLAERRGAFVSLYCSTRLRGCVGQVEHPGALADVVASSAISAALHDSRFSPIEAAEVNNVDIELSVLSTLELIRPEEITVGTHGLFIVQSAARGLLLPQVASERNWTPRRFLEETCVKAGLLRDAWREPETRIFGFTAEIFSEKTSLG